MSGQLFKQLISGDRAALAKAITIIESTNPEHIKSADELIRLAANKNNNSLRIGITGVPGVGKSTFINGFGSFLVNEQKKKVAVLAIDPSSSQSSGSILGDKTRMETLSMLEDVFIRPSPAGGNLGGIARKTRETILLCEAAGYDTILIETVGVGQSEYLADKVVDCLLLLLLPNAGDELQGIKRGIMELADMVVLNKTDITEKKSVNMALADLNNAIHLLPGKFEGWTTSVLKNGLNNMEDTSAIWEGIQKFISHQQSSGNFEDKRKRQQADWFNESLLHQLEFIFLNNPDIKHEIETARTAWEKGETTINTLAQGLIKKWKSDLL